MKKAESHGIMRARIAARAPVNKHHRRQQAAAARSASSRIKYGIAHQRARNARAAYRARMAASARHKRRQHQKHIA